MPAIHLIEDLGNMKMLDKTISEWESGWWAVSTDTAKKLVGGLIYFHKKQTEPSFFGGRIIGYRIESDGEWIGRVVFTFVAAVDCKGVKTPKEGSGMEKKFVW